MIEEGLVTHLATRGGLVDLVGERIYPGLAPDDAPPPYITYLTVSDVGGRTLSRAAGFSVARIQLDCWGVLGNDGYSQAKRIAEQLRLGLDGFRGRWGTYVVQASWLEDKRDLGEFPDEARVSVDIMVWYQESVPELS